MTPNALADTIRDELGERVLDTQVVYDQVTVTVDPEAYPQVARFCKQTLGMTFFDFLGGVDEREDGFSVIARVYNHITRDAVLLKTMVPGGRDEPKVPTLTNVWKGANWHERETYDMFGIVFEGHPGLLPRLLTVENFEGWPLRKEFLLTSREVKPWPGAKEPGGADEEEGDKPAASTPAPGADPGDRAAAAKAKAERAKAKAAAARAKKAEERAEEQAAAASGSGESVDDPPPGGTPGVETDGVEDLADSTARPSVHDDATGDAPEDAQEDPQEEGTTDE